MSDKELRELQKLAKEHGYRDLEVELKQELKTPLSYEEAEALELSDLLGDN